MIIQIDIPDDIVQSLVDSLRVFHGEEGKDKPDEYIKRTLLLHLKELMQAAEGSKAAGIARQGAVEAVEKLPIFADLTANS
jgi:hypothetical protein